jgi:hypothetical protein
LRRYTETKEGHLRIFIKTDEESELWLKSFLRASCWDDGRSR